MRAELNPLYNPPNGVVPMLPNFSELDASLAEKKEPDRGPNQRGADLATLTSQPLFAEPSLQDQLRFLRACNNAHEFDKTIEHANKILKLPIIEIEPDLKARFLLQLLYAYNKAKRFNETTKWRFESIQLTPIKLHLKATLMLRLAIAYNRTKSIHLAINAANIGLACNPIEQDLRARLNLQLAYAYNQAEKYLEATTCTTKGLQLDSVQPDLLRELMRQAIWACQKQDLTNLADALIQAYSKLNQDKDQAIQTIQRVLNLSPSKREHNSPNGFEPPRKKLDNRT